MNPFTLWREGSSVLTPNVAYSGAISVKKSGYICTMPLPLVLGAAKGALAAAKALKAAKVAKAAKAMGSAGKMKALSSKGASAIKGPSVKKELITKGSNNVGSKENLKAAKNRLKQTKRQIDFLSVMNAEPTSRTRLVR